MSSTTGPVAIGGVGGSGTRLVAQIVSALGYRLGTDLNRAQDDLWFNLLFYRPEWFLSGAARRGKAIERGLNLQRKHALGDHRLSLPELAFLAHALADAARSNAFASNASRWAARRLYNFFRSPGLGPNAVRGWGWKEPITHLMVDEVLAHFPTARYIHVIRHGLDMSLSDNQNQLRRFGSLFGVEAPAQDTEMAPASLRYWVRANRRAIALMRRHQPERSLVVSFDRLCAEPAPEIERIIRFLGIMPGDVDIRALAAMPRPPTSIGRYRGKNLDGFDPSDLTALASLGFRLEC